MNKTPTTIAIAVALAGLLAAAAPAARAQETVEGIVAIVNDDIITVSDYRQMYDIRLNDLRSQQLPKEEFDKQLGALRTGLLDQMITELLLLQKAKELNLNVQEQMKGMIEKIKTENHFGSDADLRKAVESQGMTYETFYKQYEEGMMRQGVIYTEVQRSIALEDAEIVSYYKKNPAEFTVPTEYKLNAIYLSGENRSADEIEKLKAAVDDKLKSGTAFPETAAALSDPPMKDAKGELGTFKAGELETALEAPVERLKPGDRTGWINNKNGWYLLQLVEKKDSYLRPFEDARKEVEEKLYTQKSSVKTEAYVKTLRERSFIKIVNPDPLGLGK